MIAWSIVASCQSHLNGRGSFYATRSLLGLIEGGFIPDCVLYLSYFFKGKELPNRLAWFWTACIGTGVVSALLGYGILHMRGINGWAGWQWLFALEGAATALIGLISWAYLPPSPTQTASWFRGRKGWFSEREEIILVTRVVRDDPSKGDMHNRQAITIRKFLRTVADYDMWPFYIIALTCFMPFAPPTAYLTLTLRNVGFNTFQTNLLTIPATVGNCLQVHTTSSYEAYCSYCFGRGLARGSKGTSEYIFVSSLSYGLYLCSSRSSRFPINPSLGYGSPFSPFYSRTPISMLYKSVFSLAMRIPSEHEQLPPRFTTCAARLAA